MLPPPPAVEVVDIVDPAALDPALLKAEQPWVARGLVSHWPLVQAAGQGTGAALEYLLQFYRDRPLKAFLGEPEIAGRFFYNDSLDGFNYQQLETTLTKVVRKLLDLADQDQPAALYVGSTSVDAWLPGFRQDNDLPLAERNPLVSLWLGNRSRIAAHFDYPRNLACCVLGRRRFTVFPPEQVANLYIGPWDITPAGQPISLVDFAQPDLERFPRFETAWAAAQVAELEPGDALYLPGMWWHHVESLAPVNGLVNYWWSDTPDVYGTPTDAFHHALLSIKSQSPAQKVAWKAFFDHYVFGDTEEALAHLPPASRGRLGDIDDTQARRLRAELQNLMRR